MWLTPPHLIGVILGHHPKKLFRYPCAPGGCREEIKPKNKSSNLAQSILDVVAARTGDLPREEDGAPVGAALPERRHAQLEELGCLCSLLLQRGQM